MKGMLPVYVSEVGDGERISSNWPKAPPPLTIQLWLYAKATKCLLGIFLPAVAEKNDCHHKILFFNWSANFLSPWKEDGKDLAFLEEADN